MSKCYYFAIIKLTRFSSSDFSADLLPENSLVDLEYIDDMILLNEDVNRFQSLLTALRNNATRSSILLLSSKCKILLQDWWASKDELLMGNEVVGTTE